MKKIYQAPKMIIIKAETQHMIAGSLFKSANDSYNESDVSYSREGDSWFDD